MEMKPKFLHQFVKFGARVCAVEMTGKVRYTYLFGMPVPLSWHWWPSNTSSAKVVYILHHASLLKGHSQTFLILIPKSLDNLIQDLVFGWAFPFKRHWWKMAWLHEGLVNSLTCSVYIYIYDQLGKAQISDPNQCSCFFEAGSTGCTPPLLLGVKWWPAPVLPAHWSVPHSTPLQATNNDRSSYT